MAGTKAGGRKAASTNKTKYGKDFYAEIGRKGGKNGHTGGFAANPELAKIAGVEMPITEAIYKVTKGEITAPQALEALMNRSRKSEF